MTIKLLTPRDLTIGGRTVTYPAGALVTLDAATETGLINSKEATATLTDGITYTPPVPSGQPVPLTATTSSGGVADLPLGNGQLSVKITPRLSAWSVALSKVIAGIAPATINCIGDSTTMGARSGPGATDLRVNSWPVRLAEALNAWRPGLASHASFFGDQGAGQSIQSADPRIGALPSGWFHETQSYVSFGGKMWRCGSSSTGKLSFTPGVQWDEVDIYYYGGSGYGTMTLDVGGAVLATRALTTPGINKLTIGTSDGLTLANQTLYVGRDASVVKEFFIVGFECRNSSAPAVNVRMLGVGGSTSAYWADKTSAYSTGYGHKAAAADLTIFNLGINDWIQQKTAAEFIPSMNAIRADILSVKPAAEFMLIKQPAMDDPIADQLVILGAIDELAKQWGCGVLDMRQPWPDTWAACNAMGVMADVHHPNKVGYIDIAQRILPRIVF